MKVTLESTTKIVELNGVPARVWQGQTESGVEVHAFITRIAVRDDTPPEELKRFEDELHEQAAPRPEVQAIDARLLL